MVNPFLSTHPTWVKHIKDRKKAANRRFWILCPIFFIILAGIGHFVKPNPRANNLIFLLTLYFWGFLFLSSRLNDWATKLSLRPADRMRANDWIRKLVTGPETPAKSAWDINALEGALDREFSRNWESGKALTHALLVEGVEAKQLLEAALRRENEVVSGVLLDQMMENVRTILQLLPLTLLVALVFAGGTFSLLERVAVVADPILPWLAGFVVFASLLLCYAVWRDRNPEALLKPLQYIFSLVLLIVAIIYGQTGVERIRFAAGISQRSNGEGNPRLMEVGNTPANSRALSSTRAGR